MAEWQPIATAPEGKLLLYFPDRQVSERVHHKEMVLIARVSDYGEGQSGPTRWMPLPANSN